MNRPRQTRSNLPPCVYLKHGAYYLVKRGKWHRLGVELGPALVEYARLTAGARAGDMPRLIGETLAALPDTLAASTRAQYRLAAEVLARKLREFNASEVTSQTVVDVRRSLAKSPNMANRILSFLRKTLDHALESGLITSNPCVGVRRLTEAKRTRLIEPDEWRAIYAQAGPRLQVIMRLQFLTGQRIGDVLKLRRDQLRADGIVFRQQKTGRPVLIRWTPELVEAVADANGLLTPGAPTPLSLLVGRYGGPPDYRSVALQWEKAAEAAGVADARLNDVRAMSGTAADQQGRNPRDLLGHTTDAMTLRYLRDRAPRPADGPRLSALIGSAEGPNIRQSTPEY